MKTQLMIELPNGIVKTTEVKYGPEVLMDMGCKMKSANPKARVWILQDDNSQEIELDGIPAFNPWGEST